MDWIELTIHTTTAGADIVSEALMAEGATGTMVEDRADIPDPDKPNGYWEIIDPNLIASMPEDVLVHAWFTPDSSFADRMQALRSRCDELHHMDLGLDLGTLEISTLNVRDEDWAEVWKKFYKPFKAGRSLVVKPTWEHYEPQPGDRIIEIGAVVLKNGEEVDRFQTFVDPERPLERKIVELTGITDEMLAADRRALCGVDEAALKAMAADLGKAAEHGTRVAFGSKEAVEAAKELFDRVETL